MIRTPGELYRFTGFDVPARGADPDFQLDALQRRVDQECREKTAALARENQLTREIQALRGERDRALRALEEAHLNTLHRLARAAEQKDGEAGQHMRRIGLFSGLIAEALGYPEAYCELLYKAAQLHNIGKIGIHESILRKPGPLTTDEWKLMREHPRIGAGILSGSDLPLLQLAAEISLSHHEHFSGAGYPLGSAGIAIPLSGRIVGLADFFDALTMDRCYRKALPDDEVLAMIRERRGQQFDPRIVDAFMRIADQIVLARDSINEVEAICDLPDIHGDWWMAF